MQQYSSPVYSKCSLSLSTLLSVREQGAAKPAAKAAAKAVPKSAARLAAKPRAKPAVARAVGLRMEEPQVTNRDLVHVIVETKNAKRVMNQLQSVGASETITTLTENAISASASLPTVRSLLANELVTFVQTKKRSKPHLDRARRDAGVLKANGSRQVSETGKGVVIGIVDTGFDLSHPMFRDANHRLRVDALLEQREDGTSTEFSTAQLEAGWSNGTNPGRDDDGHGTHVACIAGGSRFRSLEGVAPEARFVLVKTDFINTDVAVSWIYQAAGTRPCVVNMSLGHHMGAHDGTDAEERLHTKLTGPGKLVVISAGNEREDDIHIGGRFISGQKLTVPFQVDRPDTDAPAATITLWYDPADRFEFNVVSPTGAEFPMPRIGREKSFPASQVRVDLVRGRYAASNLIQAQVHLGFGEAVKTALLRNWKLQIQCVSASIGRLDGWFADSGRFLNSPLIEQARTIGLSATGPACIAVASHVTKTTWKADNGVMEDTKSVIGRSSSFSSLGPTRDGRQKPDYSAPGEWITSALARDSEEQDDDQSSNDAHRLLTIGGTSMAAPMVAGVIALLLQKKKTLTPDQVRSILTATAVHDAHTGASGWNPTYGNGKIDVAAALSRI